MNETWSDTTLQDPSEDKNKIPSFLDFWLVSGYQSRARIGWNGIVDGLWSEPVGDIWFALNNEHNLLENLVSPSVRPNNFSPR